MADKKLTVFQKMGSIFRGGDKTNLNPALVSSESPYIQNSVLYSTSDRDAYENKLNTLKQQKLLAYQWQKAGADNAMESLAGYTAVKLMYRDCDLMDGTPEIGTALDIVAEETCPLNSKGKMLNVYSKSPRIKSILEDLFVNRLHIYTELPMIARHLAKYGNTYMLLNVDKDYGILGWTMLPVYEIDRLENGYASSYALTTSMTSTNEIKNEEVQFVWLGHNESLPYKYWQVAHFRLLKDSFFLPYGVSMLHKARRAWRMWSMMEDAMLIWRLDKAIERRVYKIYVGGIDDQDVQAYVQEIANNFKRTAIIDPATGQVDLRKNFLDVSSDYFIPVRREDAPNPIETLQAANSQVQMEDIEYVQNKILTAIRTPKAFLNFQDAQGKGQNLSFLDIRFSRMINTHQQYLLMELNKIAMEHLYLLGLGDEISNFELSFNNPSSQIETLELENLNKRLSTMQVAVADPGNGIPMMSMHKALKEIMKMSDSEIKDMLNEIYLEKAMAAEMQTAAGLIKKTEIFEPTKRRYGDFEALANPQAAAPQQNQGDEMGGMGGGGGLGGIGGGMDMDMDMGAPGGEEGSDLSGGGEIDMGGAPSADNGSPLMENKILLEQTKRNGTKSFMKEYLNLLSESEINEDCTLEEAYDYEAKALSKDIEMGKIFTQINDVIEEYSNPSKGLIEESVDDKGEEIELGIENE